jgi:hypothetical protein
MFSKLKRHFQQFQGRKSPLATATINFYRSPEDLLRDRALKKKWRDLPVCGPLAAEAVARNVLQHIAARTEPEVGEAVSRLETIARDLAKVEKPVLGGDSMRSAETERLREEYKMITSGIGSKSQLLGAAGVSLFQIAAAGMLELNAERIKWLAPVQTQQELKGFIVKVGGFRWYSARL